MKRKVLALILPLLSVIGIGTAATAQPLPSDAEIKAILQRRIDQQKQSVGIVVGIIDASGSRVISYGVLDRSRSRPVDGDTLFEIGSITKVFTAAALADMAERGELRLSDPISKFLPNSVKTPTRNGHAITLLSLATHTSGLPRLPNNLAPADPSNPYADYTIDQLYSFLSGYTLTRDIGAQYEYSNLGMGLLGHVLSLKAGVDFETLIKSRITQPLQMTSTQIQIAPEQRSRFATGHNSLSKPVSYWDLPTLAGAGGLRSTANDLLKFLAANLELTQSPLSATLQKTHRVQQQTDAPDAVIAIGWHVLKRNGTEIVTHSGGTGGFRSFIGLIQSKRLGVVVLSNSENSIDDIGLHLLDRRNPLANPTPPKQRKAIQLDPKHYDVYVGRYELAPNFILTITKEQNRLFAQATGQVKVELFPETATQFFITEVDAQITFVTDKQGRTTQLILHQAGQQIPAKKLP